MYLHLLRSRDGGPALCGPLALLVVVAAGGCGGSSAQPGPDGGQANFRLTVLDPPGESIGLPYGGDVTLRVRYEDDHGDAISGAKVAFSTAASGAESTGGATLSSDSATTNGDGIAAIDLVSGAEQVNFRVAATAANAPPAYFYIAVSQGGFTNLSVTPVYRGARPESDFRQIEVRLYPAAVVACADLDVDAPPPSVFPPRALDQFGSSVAYRNASAGEGYTLLGWALAGGGNARVASGCVDLGAAQVLPGRTESLALPLDDRPAALPQTVALTSRFDLAPLQAAISNAGADAPWRTLACPAGPGQLLLDCTLDAAAGDGTIDCVLNGPQHALADAVAASRGAPDQNGCRPATLSGGGASLDGELATAVAAGGTFPTGSDLDALLAARRDTLTSAEIDSELAPMSGVGLHTLKTLRITVASQPFDVDLGATARPVIAREATLARDGTGGGQLEIGAHSFTLRYGSAALAAFRAEGLAAVGLDNRADALGTALAGSAMDAGGDTGCAAVSRIICKAAGQAAGCATSACTAAAAALDDRLQAWAQFADGAGLDFQLKGSAPIYDFNDDLTADSVGRAADGTLTGTWTATLTASTGQAVQLSGTFGSSQMQPAGALRSPAAP